MVGSLLLRGMLVGVLAGLLSFGFARVFGEPAVARAIAFEEAHAEGPAPAAAPASPAATPHVHADGSTHMHAAAPEPAAAGHSHGGEEELVSRSTQAGLGLMTGMVVYGAAMGGIFALVFAFALGRVGPLSPRATAVLLALGGFLAIVLVPALKYPANPPAVGDGATIGFRTQMFFLMLAASLVALAGAVLLARRLAARYGAWNGTVAAGLAYVVAIALVQAVLPTINEVPAEFSAALLWEFRIANLGIQAVLWATLGLAFGPLAERSLRARRGVRLAPASALR
ncbi:CbtA family protein [Roseixanthobacter liquoris]|uniref:CbtA family protein n=1 Tax=Roseixanthobacter liquoris TaxID=3119921 RepID=UPI00372CA75C